MDFQVYFHKNQFSYTRQGRFVKAIGGDKSLFFTKINFGFYLKALSSNYKLVFIEFKNFFVNSFQFKCMDQKFFEVNFLGNLKNH